MKQDPMVERLYASSTFKRALDAARSEEERESIRSAAVSFVSSFGGMLSAVTERAQRDPEFAKRLGMELVAMRSVLSNMPIASSGSLG